MPVESGCNEGSRTNPALFQKIWNVVKNETNSSRYAIGILEGLVQSGTTNFASDLAPTLLTNINAGFFALESFALLSIVVSIMYYAEVLEIFPYIIKLYNTTTKSDCIILRSKLTVGIIRLAELVMIEDYRNSTNFVDVGLVPILLSHIKYPEDNQNNSDFTVLWMLTLRQRNLKFFTEEQKEAVLAMYDKLALRPIMPEVDVHNEFEAAHHNLSHGISSLNEIQLIYIISVYPDTDEEAEITYQYVLWLEFYNDFISQSKENK